MRFSIRGFRFSESKLRSCGSIFDRTRSTTSSTAIESAAAPSSFSASSSRSKSDGGFKNGIPASSSRLGAEAVGTCSPNGAGAETSTAWESQDSEASVSARGSSAAERSCSSYEMWGAEASSGSKAGGPGIVDEFFSTSGKNEKAGG